MAEKEFNARSEIMAMIAKTSDDVQRMVWVMMLGLLEQQEVGFGKIDKKLDTLLSDDESLRKSVLNGHKDTHHDDHDWVQARRKSKCEDVCEWSRKKMEQEVEDAKSNKASARKIRDNMIERALWMALAALLAGIGVWSK